MDELIQWLAINWLTIVSIILSGIISLVVSAAYYHKGNRNNLQMTMLFPIVRLLNDSYSLANYKNLCDLSQNYCARYLTKKERAVLVSLVSAYSEVSNYKEINVNADSLISYFEYTLKNNGIVVKPVPIIIEDETVGYDYPPDYHYIDIDLQNILKQLEEVPEVRVLHDMAIRSQAKAVYSDVNIGHFGLGSKCYSHFTSPIRRYPDLILHRLLKDYNYNYSDKIINERKEELPIESEHCSIREQDAQNCERDVDKMKKAEYMADHIGEIYEGIISGVQEFGIFVELENTVEGLIKAENIKGDYYVYDSDMMALIGKKTKKKYAFGDKITIRVVRADKDKSEIDFEVYDEKEKQINNKKKQK